MKGSTVVLTALVGTALAAATALQARRGVPATEVLAAVPVRAAQVAAEGRVVAYPGAEVRVSAERAGRLTSLTVQEGQVVRRGDVLASIESEELTAARSEAISRVAESEAEMRLALLNRGRRQQLVDESIAAPLDLDQATRDLEIAHARRDTARAVVARLEAQLRNSLVRAPIAGTVITRHLDAGETVEAGDAIVTIADLGRLRIEGEADEADAGALAVGGLVRVTSEAYPSLSWRGRIEEVGAAASLRRLKPQDPARPTDTRILPVKIALVEPTPLKLGTTVELRLAQ